MPIRTLGFYQPFGSLMFHGKVETRWVIKGRTPPFPAGRYALYSTLKPCENYRLFDWCGPEIVYSIGETLAGDLSRFCNGCILGYADLIGVRPMTKEDEQAAFVKFIGERTEKDITKVQWAIIFANCHKITPIKFEINGRRLGKQGVGYLPVELWPQENKPTQP